MSVPVATVRRMAYSFQVMIDAADPHTLADWWAEALDWVVEPSDETFIRTMIEEGYATEDDTITYNGSLVWKDGAAIRHPEDPDRGPRRRLVFQSVPEPKTVKNRVHLDIWVGKDNIETELERLTKLGATFLHRGQQGPHTWVTIADPQGNELCLS
jgi:hypothetical protein